MMASNSNDLLIHIQGNWISQRTIYYLKTKKIKTFNIKNNVNSINKSHIIFNKNFINYDDNIFEWYINNKLSINLYLFSKSLNNISKIERNIHKEYKCIKENNNYLKIKCVNKDIECLEYIYYISKTFRISIGLIKKLNKYIAISFTSDIKIIKD